STAMKLYKTTKGILLQSDSNIYLFHEEWDALINRDNLFGYLSLQIPISESIGEDEFEKFIENAIQPPIGNQEVWAAGVTYLRSRDARMEESQDTGGADFYQKVY